MNKQLLRDWWPRHLIFSGIFVIPVLSSLSLLSLLSPVDSSWTFHFITQVSTRIQIHSVEYFTYPLCTWYWGLSCYLLLPVIHIMKTASLLRTVSLESDSESLPTFDPLNWQFHSDQHDFPFFPSSVCYLCRRLIRLILYLALCHELISCYTYLFLCRGQKQGTDIALQFQTNQITSSQRLSPSLLSRLSLSSFFPLVFCSNSIFFFFEKRCLFYFTSPTQV